MKYKGQKVSKGNVGQFKELKLAAEKEQKWINPKLEWESKEGELCRQHFRNLARYEFQF